jgi:hypothetical protein
MYIESGNAVLAYEIKGAGSKFKRAILEIQKTDAATVATKG